ncbi:MAG TPA: DinB family protein, partial [Gemmatimonadaceae bacterium]|nr:DinB family protein [Gemmatimonadaceae bacterium]
AKSVTPAGTTITTWKWARAMIEHEAHHRGQLYMTLGLLGIATPPLYGLREDQVLEASRA